MCRLKHKEKSLQKGVRIQIDSKDKLNVGRPNRNSHNGFLQRATRKLKIIIFIENNYI